MGTFSLLESTGVSVRDSASQKFREKLSRSPALGVHARAFVLPRGCPGLGTVLWEEPSPRSPGICPCSALWGIMLSSLSLEQGWLELAESQNRLELLGAVFWRSQ